MNIPGKLVTFFIQAVLVVLAVFAFSYLDPFNIFNSKKLTLKDTPVMVNSIKGIGKLITAEFYGEVIKSSLDLIEEELTARKQKEKTALVEFEEKLLDALDKIADHDKEEKLTNKRRLFRYFKKTQRDSLLTDSLYTDFLTIAKTQSLKEKDLLWNLYNAIKTDNKNNLRQNTSFSVADHFDSYFDGLHGVKPTKRTVKNSLALLGRGWVKAGIDFSNFDEEHVQYYPDKNLVRLIHHQPEIISETINPWFIPQKKIKGFEYLFVGSQLDAKPDSKETVKKIQDLKKACLESLHHDAVDAGLLVRAREQAEISLSHFLSLVLGKEVTVEIYKHPLDALEHDLLKQGKLTKRNIQTIDSAVRQYASKDRDRVFDFLTHLHDSLKATVFFKQYWNVDPAHWGIAALYFNISEDGFLMENEKDTIARYLQTHKPELADDRKQVPEYLYAALSKKSLADSLKYFRFNSDLLSRKKRDSVSWMVMSNLESLKKCTSNLKRDTVYVNPESTIKNTSPGRNLHSPN